MSSTAPTVAQQITQMQTELAAAGHLPPEIAAVFAAEQVELAAAAVPVGTPALGTPMVDGELLDVHGAPTSLTTARDGRPAVVALYRGGWCPYCNLTLRAYQTELLPELERRGVRMIAVSPQTPDASLTTAEKDELSFTVLSDPGNQLARGLDVLFAPGEDARAAQRELGLDTTAVNADGGAELPMPTVALVDAAGTLRFLDVHPDYTTRTEPAAILDAIDAELGLPV